MKKKYAWRIILLVVFFFCLMIASSLIKRDSNWGYAVLLVALLAVAFCSSKTADAEDMEVMNRSKH